ncbi:MAG: hypothetical protein FWD05_02615 [Oscillospiraceae bacterium]|nr:hypothetical protein [Oscillospiraceae bacterium]
MKRFFTLLHILLPSILVSGFILLDFQVSIYLIAIYIITIISVVLFFVFKKPCGFWAILLGMFISPTFLLVYEVVFQSMTRFSRLIIMLYTMPFLLLFSVILGIMLVIKMVRGKHTDLITKEDE